MTATPNPDYVRPVLGSICTGIGGLDLAVEAHFGAELVWCAEIDHAASLVLAARFSGVPNLGDFRDATPPAVDILCGGFPCQPVSSAGKRAGTDDERWLFDDICTLVGRMDTPPRVLVFENVAGLLTANGGHAMARVVHGLAALGYVGSWRSVRASDAGACHRRERVFIVATHTDGGRFEERTQPDGRASEHRRGARRDHVDRLGHPVADADGARAGRKRGAVPRPHRSPRRADEHVRAAVDARPDIAADAAHLGHERCREARHRRCGSADRDWGPYGPAITRWEHVIGRPAPEPVDDRGRLSPRFVEWMMGFDDGWCTGLLHPDVDPRPVHLSRTQTLKCLGNAVVQQQARLALAAQIDGSGALEDGA